MVTMMNMNEMMTKMMENMMEQMATKMMESMMTAMMSSMGAPAVAPAEAVAPEKPKTMSREDFLALEESKPTAEPVATAEPLDLVTSTEVPRTLVFNQTCSSDLWTINWISLKHSFPNVKYNAKTRGFHWNAEHSAEFKLACQTFKVVTTLTEKDKEAIKVYRREKAQRQADYYAKKAKE